MQKIKMKGYFYTTLSVVLFYLMTISVKFITIKGNLAGTEIAFFRFFIGLIIILIAKFKTREVTKPINKKAVYARVTFNTASVILFFIVIQLSSPTKANIYNLTYPVFVAFFAPFFLPEEKFTMLKVALVITTFIGTYLIAGVSVDKIEIADILGIFLGIVSSFSIISLKKARITDTPFTILFHLMMFGTIITLLSFGWSFKLPNSSELIMLIIMGILSFGGQFTLTKGFKYITTVEGSLISASRIFLATICGILFFKESFNLNILIGGSLIFASIVIISKENKQVKIKTSKI